AVNRSLVFPRFLLGAALLFWSLMSGQWVMGVGLAIAVELAHWVSVRWDFHQAAFVRAWNLSLLLVIARVALTLFESSSLQVVPELMQWLPLLFFPLQFTQS